ncbi:thioredoxin-like domain-containing protein [Aneurinibacillus aneurinilyticus]|uniref:TlpA family protein disulfide reductase n=1 Tax=Aneurinibacillus aneurinilyticus TaxID=1391 RepID=UPI002E1E1825|nr:thioredoxin-like domain-containing protein [Aneurinibacillus aneurinilyticus]
MSTINEWISLATLLLVLFQFGVVYLLARYIGNFINQIKGIRGIQFGGINIGESVPLFRELDYKGNRVILGEILSSKKVALLFINSNCPTCKSILPYLGEILNNVNVKFIIINNDTVLDDNLIKTKIPEEVIYLRSSKIANTYFVNKVPYLMVIDRDGKLEQHNYLNNVNTLANMVNSLDRIVS